MGDDVTVLNSNIRDEPPMEEPPDHEDSPAYEEVKLTSTDPKTKVELTSTEPKTKFEQADNEEDPTNTQREGSLSKSADDKPAGEPQDTTVQPHNLIGDFAAAAASESPETEESKLLVTRATGSELEPVIPAPCSVLTEVFSSYHASDDEDFVSRMTQPQGKGSHLSPAMCIRSPPVIRSLQELKSRPRTLIAPTPTGVTLKITTMVNQSRSKRSYFQTTLSSSEWRISVPETWTCTTNRDFADGSDSFYKIKSL